MREPVYTFYELLCLAAVCAFVMASFGCSTIEDATGIELPRVKIVVDAPARHSEIPIVEPDDE